MYTHTPTYNRTHFFYGDTYAKKASAPKNRVNYDSFGAPLENRTESESSSYRFGFNGVEKENDLNGEGNAYAFEYRIHNPRIGRFLSVDPLAKEYPWNSTYSFAENDVIRCLDLEGAEKFNYLEENPYKECNSVGDGCYNVLTFLSNSIIVKSNNGITGIWNFGVGVATGEYGENGAIMASNLYSGIGEYSENAYTYATETPINQQINYIGSQVTTPDYWEGIANMIFTYGVMKSLPGKGIRSNPISSTTASEIASEIEYKTQGSITTAYYDGEALGTYTHSSNAGLELDLRIPTELQGKGLGPEIFKNAVTKTGANKFSALWTVADIYENNISVNLSKFRKLVNELGPEGAAWETWSGKQAKKAGFTNVNVEIVDKGVVRATFTKGE